MIKETVNEYRFRDAFRQSDNYKNKFSYHGLKALYEYLEQLSEDIGEDIELDVCAIACDYSEYDSAYEAMEQYQPEDMPVEGEAGDDLVEIQEKNEASALEWLQERTQVMEVERRDYSKGISDAPIIRSVIIQTF